MDLSEIYSKNVSKSPISTLSVGGNFPTIERDKNLINLEQSVFSKLREISGPDEPILRKKPNTPKLNTVSVEDALKELLNIQNIS